MALIVVTIERGAEAAKAGGGGLRRALLGLLALSFLALAGVFLPLRAWLTDFLAFSEGLGRAAPVILGAFYVPAAVLLLPGSLLTLGAGFVLGFVPGFFAVLLGATAGATAAFLLGRTVARPLVEARMARDPRFSAVQGALAERGFRMVLLLRLSPLLPFNLLNYALGLTRVRLRDYVAGTLLGMIPGSAMYVYLGTAARSLAEVAAGEVQGGAGPRVFLLAGLVVTVVVAVWIGRVARRALAEAGAVASDAERA